MNRRKFAAISAMGLASGVAVAHPQQGSVVDGAAGERTSRRKTEPFPEDPHRPRFHFLPPRNWMNDPNGLIYHRGLYHLFYQHNPGAAVWGDMHWGHAMSNDLLTWKNLPIALSPTPGSYDKDGVFSGCAVVNGSEPTVIYTGTQPEVQAIATSSDALLERWVKYTGNPVISKPPAGMDAGFRDPYVWREGDEWLMALGSGVKSKGGCVLLYRSPDLRSWEYLHPLVESEDLSLGRMWECPNLFPIGGEKHVLLISPVPLKKSLWAVGTYADRRFRPERWGSLDDGGHFYTPQAFLDSADRRVIFGWNWEGRTKEAQVKAGWAGAQSLPRVLTLGEDGGLQQEPHTFCQRLVRFGKSVKDMPLGDDLHREMEAAGMRGNAARLHVVIDPQDMREMGLSFYRSPDGSEETRLVYDAEKALLRIDRNKSSLSDEQERTEHSAPLRLSKGESLQLTLFFDRSMVEVYANDRCCLTTRVYPTRSDSIGLRLWGDGKKSLVREITWHPIALRTS